MRRALASLLSIAVFVSVNGMALQPAASSTPADATLVYDLTDVLLLPSEPLALSATTSFASGGGWAVIDPYGETPELLHYSATGVSNLLGTTRPDPYAHPAGTTIVPLQAEEVRAGSGVTGASLPRALTLEDAAPLALDSVAAFDPRGGWALVDAGSPAAELIYYGGTDTTLSLLTDLSRPEPVAHAQGSSVDPIEVPAIFPLVVDPPPVVVTAPPPPPLIVDPPGAGGQDLSPVVGEAVDAVDGTTVDPSPVGGADLGAVIDDVITPVEPITIDPPPVGGQDLSAEIDQLIALLQEALVPIDPPPVGGQDLSAEIDQLIALLQEALVPIDPPPVGGQDLGAKIDQLIALLQDDLAPIDPPPVGGQDLGAKIDQLIALLQDALIPIDPPPVGGQNLGDALDAVIAPLPPVYLDPPPLGPVVADPTIPGPITVTLPPLGPVAVDPPPLAPVVADPPPLPPVYLNPPAPGPVAYDPPPVGGGTLYLPSVPVCPDEGEVLALAQAVVTLLSGEIYETKAYAEAAVQQAIGQAPTPGEITSALYALLDDALGQLPPPSEVTAQVEQILASLLEQAPSPAEVIALLNQVIEGLISDLPDPSLLVDQAMAILTALVADLPDPNAVIDAILGLIDTSNLPDASGVRRLIDDLLGGVATSAMDPVVPRAVDADDPGPSRLGT